MREISLSGLLPKSRRPQDSLEGTTDCSSQISIVQIFERLSNSGLTGIIKNFSWHPRDQLLKEDE
jgi:hypothetical protein